MGQNTNAPRIAHTGATPWQSGPHWWMPNKIFDKKVSGGRGS